MKNENFVRLETANLLEKLGFDWGCSQNSKFYPEDGFEDCPNGTWTPRLDVVQKWLRDVKNIDIEIHAEVGMLHKKVYIPYVSFYWTYVLTDIDKEYGLTEEKVKTENLVSQKKMPIHYEDDENLIKAHQYFDTYEEAQEVAILFACEWLKKHDK